MKLVYVQNKKSLECFYGILEGDTLKVLSGNPFKYDAFEYFENQNCIVDSAPIEDYTLLAPVMPSKIVAVGKNYHAHALEMKEGEPEEPLLFLKPNTTIAGPNDDVCYPSISHRLDYEGELGVVIGRCCRNVSQADALSYVFGYTCLNDITARDIQKSDPQWTRGKSFDTFCPIGPCIVTDIQDPQNLHITTRLNGKVVQNSNTSMMTHSIPRLIEYISRVMTLFPGDIIATGTPEGIGSMQPGDRVEVEIESIGVLENRIAAEGEHIGEPAYFNKFFNK